MAGILFVYTRTSIQAAKRNAQKHREADGGQINWHNENLRRHGHLDPPVEQASVKQLLGTAKENVTAKPPTSEPEQKVRELAGTGRRS